MSDWQPIETARKGTIQDVLISDGRQVILAWLDDAGYWNDSTVGDTHDPVIDWQPTHWMPLPEPPQSERTGA